MSEKLIKYIASFKCLIVLTITSDSLFIASFATFIGRHVGIENAILVFHFQCLQEL